jgi:hypothetical protein
VDEPSIQAHETILPILRPWRSVYPKFLDYHCASTVLGNLKTAIWTTVLPTRFIGNWKASFESGPDKRRPATRFFSEFHPDQQAQADQAKP